MKPLNPPPPRWATRTPPSETAATRREAKHNSGKPRSASTASTALGVRSRVGYPPGNRRTTLPLDARIPATSALGPCKHPTTGTRPGPLQPTPPPPALPPNAGSPQNLFSLCHFPAAFFIRRSPRIRLAHEKGTLWCSPKWCSVGRNVA
jgi:hypothetical protein